MRGITDSADVANKVFGSAAAGLNVFRADLKDLLEADADVCEFTLEHDHDVLCVLAFLAFGRLGVARIWVLRAHEYLQGGDLGVYRGEVLLDDVGELGDLDGAVVKEGFAFGHCRRGGNMMLACFVGCDGWGWLRRTLCQPFQLPHRSIYTPSNLSCLSCKLAPADFPAIRR